MYVRVVTFALLLQLASAQFEFNPGTYGSSELYDFLSGYYNSYASIWEAQITSARASLPGAYSQLTSIFNTDSIPDSFDPVFVSHLVQEMIEMGHTTIVDPQINGNTLVFTPTQTVKSQIQTVTDTTPKATDTPSATGSKATQTQSTQAQSTSHKSETMPAEVSNLSTDSDFFTLKPPQSIDSENGESSDTEKTSSSWRLKPLTLYDLVLCTLVAFSIASLAI